MKRKQTKEKSDTPNNDFSVQLLSLSFVVLSKQIDEMIDGLNCEECSDFSKEELMTLMLRVLDSNRRLSKDYVKGLLIVSVLRLRSELKGGSFAA